MSSLRDRIADVLLSRQLVRKEQLDEALALQKSKGGSLQKILIERGMISEDDLVSAISQGLGIPPISLNRLKPDPNLKNLVSRQFATQNQLVPVSQMGQRLTVAMADPLNIFTVDNLAAMTGLTIQPLVTTQKDIVEAIDRYYGIGVEETLKELVEKNEFGDMEIVSDSESEDSDTSSLLKQAQETPVIKFTDAILKAGVRLKASDIFIEPRERSIRVRYRVDGMLQEGPSPPKSLHNAIVSRIKVMADLDIAERRIPQDGHFKLSIGERVIDFRLNVLPAIYGSNVCMRIQDKGAISLDIKTLGFAQHDLDKLTAAAQRPHGMLLATGPTGTGKTTTLYSLLKLIDSPERNIVTVEDPVEFELRGINQVGVKADIGLTFAASLRSILRQDPDVIMVGEIRDTETADMAIKSALTGHLVLSTLHTNSASGTVTRLVNMGVQPFLINSSVLVVIAQRLVRKTCKSCAESYRPEMEVARRLGLLDDKGKPLELLRPKGCRSCFQSGYAGREVIAEVLPFTPEIRALVMKSASGYELEQVARSQGMKTLREQGLAKASAKVTSLEEVFRTTIGDMIE
jgi:type IV pilus assembly protein PilB